MEKIWLPNGEPGLAHNGTALAVGSVSGCFRYVGILAVGPEGEGIPLHLRYTGGFEVDKLDRPGEGRLQPSKEKP